MDDKSIPEPIPVPYAAPVLVPVVAEATAPHMYDVSVSAMPIPGGRSNDGRNRMTEEQIDSLVKQGYTRGLAKAVGENNDIFALRIWIVDNSGSMATPDGHRFLETKSAQQEIKVVSCTRWKEIQGAVKYHIHLAALLKAPTTFRLLNDPGSRVGPKIFDVANKGDHLIDNDVIVALSTIENASPSGVTPLSEHIHDIRQQIASMAPILHAEGRKVSIIIATDGMPTDNRGVGGSAQSQDFVNAMRSLEGLPVWITIRLCTDDDNIVEFYNDLDSQLELSVEVLDDYIQEAREVYKKNKWFNYTLPLHRCREMGFCNRLMDMLDERTLTLGELHEFCILILGVDQFDGVPEPAVDFKAFYKSLKNILKNEKKQWNSVKQYSTHVIDPEKMYDVYGDGHCIIQ